MRKIVTYQEQAEKQFDNMRKNELYMAKKSLEKAKKELEEETCPTMIKIIKNKIKRAEDKIAGLS